MTHPHGIKDFLNRETRPLAGSLYFKKSSISTLDIRPYAPVTLMQHPNRRSRPQHVTTMIHTYLLLRLPYRYARLLCDVVHSLGQQPLYPKGFLRSCKATGPRWKRAYEKHGVCRFDQCPRTTLGIRRACPDGIESFWCKAAGCWFLLADVQNRTTSSQLLASSFQLLAGILIEPLLSIQAQVTCEDITLHNESESLVSHKRGAVSPNPTPRSRPPD